MKLCLRDRRFEYEHKKTGDWERGDKEEIEFSHVRMYGIDERTGEDGQARVNDDNNHRRRRKRKNKHHRPSPKIGFRSRGRGGSEEMP